MVTYTHEQLEIALLKQKNESFNQNLIEIKDAIVKLDSKLEESISRLDSKLDNKITWVLGLMGTGFAGMLGIMAHGFHWII